ncbi:CDP-2,3-bis-(O-geranylgeranyl)-sn-glycerol synthase [Candidatus Falkowbacteria bacterium]|nr:CDP-2,3-bis-(O-geranylgeranyl)-sn-glycerol synthase [Candidatus Falkowbacteria bacterium]
MLPAYIANMAPVFAEKFGVLKFFSRPVDGGRTFRGKPIFGNHKTWRGFLVGVALAVAVAWLQYFLYAIPVFQKISLLNYSAKNFWFLGFLLGFGALFGDLIKSFFKRRVNLAPGASWIPFDQIDFVLGALIFSAPIYFPPWPVVIIILLASPVLHIITNNIGFLLRVKNTRW